jgi:hypothetical protein
MAILNSIATVAPGFGSSDYYVSRTAVTANIGTTVVTLPVSGSLAPTARAGRLRVKSSVIGVNATFLVTKITVTDGTTVVSVYEGDAAATAAGIGFSLIVDWIADINVTSVSISVTVATANSSVDAEMIYTV